MGLVVSAIACYWVIRLTVLYVAARQQSKVAERAAKRAAQKIAYERNGYTVITDALSGEITHYFKSGPCAARGDSPTVTS